MEPGAAGAKVGPGPGDTKMMSVKEQQAVGYDKSMDTPFEEIVAKQPGATWGPRYESAIQLVLEGYDYDKDTAMRELREGGTKGVIRFAADGTPLGGKAIAGALRAMAKHPRMYKLLTKAEMQDEMDRAGERFRKGEAPRSKRRVLTPDERASRDAQAARRAQAREQLERSGGGTDLRRRPTAGKTRRADIAAKGTARRESYARAVREAKAARQAAERAARAAASA